MKIHCKYDKLVSVDELKQHTKNANRHPADQIKRLAKILAYQGFRYPIKVSNQSGMVTSGHGRIEASKLNGWKEVPVNYQDYESMDQEIADLHADNTIASWAEFDMDFLAQQLPELDSLFDTELLGLKDLPTIENIGLVDEDETPEVKTDAIAKLGDLYKLGEHRLLCGDSTNIQHVEKLMAGEKADMIFTSPPYNANTVMYEATGSYNDKNKIVTSKTLYIDNTTDNKTTAEYLEFNKSILSNCFLVMKDGAPLFYNINYNKNSQSEYIDIIHSAKSIFNLCETIVWKKHMAISLMGNNLTRIYEFIFLLGKNTKEIKMFKTKFSECVKNLWEISNIKANTENHKACFPVSLPEYAINHYSDKSFVLFEPFGGSGSTLIACEKTNRKCFMMELDEHYIDVIIKRFIKYSGKPVLRLNDDGTNTDVTADFKATT